MFVDGTVISGTVGMTVVLQNYSNKILVRGYQIKKRINASIFTGIPARKGCDVRGGACGRVLSSEGRQDSVVQSDFRM